MIDTYFKAEPFQEMDPLMSDNDTSSRQLKLENIPMLGFLNTYGEFKY